MTSIAKCGTTAAPHRISEINGVGTCLDCGAKFIDGVLRVKEDRKNVT